MTTVAEPAIAQTPASQNGSASRNPAWYRQLIADLVANIATTFICAGAGTHDYQYGIELCADWLTSKLARYETVVRFNVGTLESEPLSFSGTDNSATPANDLPAGAAQGSPRDRFELLCGLRPPTGAAAAPAGPDPFATLRQGQPAGAPGARPLPTSSVDIVRLLMRFLRASPDQKAAVIIERADLLAPPADFGTMPDAQKQIIGMLSGAGTDPTLVENGNPLILLAPSIDSVHPDLPSAKTGIQTIDVPLPDQQEQLAFLRLVQKTKTAEAEAAGVAPVRMEITLEEITRLTAGLYRRHGLDIWLRGEQVGAITKSLVITRKNEIMVGEYREVLETMEPRFSFKDVGGNTLLKEWLLEHVVERMKTGKTKRLPKGIIFTGPSGTGKTLLAEALAWELGINVVLLRPEKIKGSLYGEAEQRLARAIAGIRANVPCLVFIDEIDQRFRRGGGGAGGAADAAENNIFGRILEEVGDPGTRGQILWNGATNRPKLCDAALFRPGRFDEKLPILPPLAEERQGIFETLVARHADGDVPSLVGADWKKLVSTSDGWTGAEIEQSVISAYDLAELRDVPMPKALLRAAEELIPSTRDIVLHTDEAIAECNRRELLPAAYRQRARDEEQLARSADELERKTSPKMRRRRDIDETD